MQTLPKAFSVGSTLDPSSGDVCKSLWQSGSSLEGAALVRGLEVALMLSVEDGSEVVGVGRVVLMLLEHGGSESAMIGELIVAVVAELVVGVVSAVKLVVVVEVVSVGVVSLEEVEGTAGLSFAG